MSKKKRPADIWNEISANLSDTAEHQKEAFTNEPAKHREGISADREKFILDLKTGSPKVLPPDKNW